MKISVFGLGYVGSVSAGCLARDGHQVLGVDPNPTKVGLIANGQSPIIEQHIGEIIADSAATGRLCATTDAQAAVMATDMSLVCVGTPSQGNGSLDLRYVRHVCEEIGRALADKGSFHTVVLRSTMLPGSMRSMVIPSLENASGKQAGTDFGVCNNPEFLREGTAVYDYDNPPKTVIGETDPESGDIVAKLYANLDAPLVRTDLETAEMVKYVDNVWHALKVGFANEIGTICKALSIDSHRVMNIFCQDTKLNLSPYYLKPGFAFGGSCLPKDVRALNYKAKALDLELPILNSIMSSNRIQIDRGIQLVAESGSKRVGILGMSFKAGTDDLRESPIVELIERLIGKGYELCVYDHNVHLASLTGANRDYILDRIPHISRLMVPTIDTILSQADVVVIGNGDPEFNELMTRLRPGQTLIDLVRLKDLNEQRSNEAYHGIAW